MDPVNLEGMTADNMSDNGAFTMKVGQGINKGKITNKYVDPNRFGKIKTKEGGTGDGYAKKATTTTPKSCKDKKAKVLKTFKGDYTPEAKRRSIEGVIVAILSVNTKGRVTNVQIVKSLGAGLDESARDAFLKFIFEPAEEGCEKVASKVRFEHGFSLDDF